MSILPQGAKLTFLQTASSINSIVIVDDVSYSFDNLQFERKEYSNDYLMNLPNSDGTYPIFQKSILGKAIQTEFVGCGENSTRNILPDDANVDNILRKFTIKKYTIKGGPSNPSAVDALDALAKDHMRRYTVFEGFFKLFGLKLSYQYIYNLRNETFNYITQSGLSMSAFSGSSVINETNCLIKSFTNGFLYRNPSNNYMIVKDWSMEVMIYQSNDPERIF